MESKEFTLVLILCMFSMLVGACNNQTELEGTWIGCDVSKPLIDWTLTVQDNQFHLVREDLSKWYIGKFKLNNNCILKKIDLKIIDSHIQAQNGKVLRGIYEIDVETLTIVTGDPGNHLRPCSFEESNGAVAYNFVRS
jgi:uncharacterized protein (TIGR03067 family)